MGFFRLLGGFIGGFFGFGGSFLSTSVKPIRRRVAVFKSSIFPLGQTHVHRHPGDLQAKPFGKFLNAYRKLLKLKAPDLDD